ncbi:DNA (cytosine-5-)-methyltransferase [Pseudoalteromonas aliena]|uniref:Cytosine-specific methyltransferase n=1 Tax=Pseudoalteromonas aliena SW19 TaxID=1314866 RepID=A0ABR9E429_9GAMM|nr:DNA (cytosine-5-)-methyltransferase [Pseudoalteromonas aliena]MBE0360655.1 DNA (cytosine-5)-methyltransferase 1 [Pseudoalteromonas aliena SW19]
MNTIEIVLARKELDLTQSQAADILHVSKRTWQQWELFMIKMNYQPESLEMKQIYTQYTPKDIKKNHEELALETHKKEQEINKNKKYKFIDLFAGIGGIRKSLESIGGGCVFSSEIDQHAQFTYYSNYGVVPFGDITKINPEDVPDHDILCGGFPCQPFSNIGKREGFEHPTQGTMFHEVLRIVNHKKPRVVFLENVSGLVNHDKGRTLEVILSELEKLGYKCHTTLLNAKDFGVPQNRNRFYLVAFLDDIDFSFPEPPMISSDIGDYIEKGITGFSISEHLQKSYLFKKDDGRPVLIDENTKGYVKTLVSTYHKIQRLTGTFVKDGETGIRLLTKNECKAIMGFPEDFIIPVSRTQMYRQMGNSVVIKVVSEIAKEIDKALSKKQSKNCQKVS